MNGCTCWSTAACARPPPIHSRAQLGRARALGTAARIRHHVTLPALRPPLASVDVPTLTRASPPSPRRSSRCATGATATPPQQLPDSTRNRHPRRTRPPCGDGRAAPSPRRSTSPAGAPRRDIFSPGQPPDTQSLPPQAQSVARGHVVRPHRSRSSSSSPFSRCSRARRGCRCTSSCASSASSTQRSTTAHSIVTTPSTACGPSRDTAPTATRRGGSTAAPRSPLS